MQRQSKVISISLPKSVYTKLELLRKREDKSRSELIKHLIQSYDEEQTWKEIYDWGKKTRLAFSIKSEQDILNIIND